MPKDVQIIGNKLNPSQVKKAQAFLSWLPLSSKPNSIVVVPDEKFFQLTKSNGSVMSVGDRLYIRDSAFNQQSGLESTLASGIVPDSKDKVAAVNSLMKAWADNNAPPKQSAFQVIGVPGDYVPTPDQVRRITNFIRWLPEKRKPGSVVVLSPDSYAKIAAQASPRHKTEAAFTVGDRTYLNSDVLNAPISPTRISKGNVAYFPKGQDVEWTLAHETGHLNSDLTPEQQERRDELFDTFANDRIAQWNNKQGQAYRSLQSQSAKVPDQFEPARAPLGTQLVPPQSSAAPSSTPAPTPAPQPGGLLTLARIGAHIPSAALGALGAASRKV